MHAVSIKHNFKLGIIFLVVAGVATFIIFNFNLFKAESPVEGERPSPEMTKELVIQFLNQETWVDYHQKPMAVQFEALVKKK